VPDWPYGRSGDARCALWLLAPPPNFYSGGCYFEIFRYNHIINLEKNFFSSLAFNFFPFTNTANAFSDGRVFRMYFNSDIQYNVTCSFSIETKFQQSQIKIGEVIRFLVSKNLYWAPFVNVSLLFYTPVATFNL
jgi:hypothetical protein